MPPTAEQRVRDLYGFDFPDEFFRYREFLAELPKEALGEACDMHPAFPFDVAAGEEAKDYPERPLWQDRYYYDLPEFVTLFTGTTDGLHWGYVFDAPGELPPVVAHYWHSDTFQHTINGEGLFEATRAIIEENEVGFLEMIDETPDDEDHYRERLTLLAVIRTELGNFWGGEREEVGEDYRETYLMKPKRKPVADTWDALGIVVPKKQYKKLSADPLTVTGGRADPQRSQVEQLTAEAMQLLRDGFPGAALKLGRDLWGWAKQFPESYELLDAAYVALGREPLRRLLAEARLWRQDCEGRWKKK
jgi:hypothetical protein